VTQQDRVGRGFKAPSYSILLIELFNMLIIRYLNRLTGMLGLTREIDEPCVMKIVHLPRVEGV
jgi:hypothetical protein